MRRTFRVLAPAALIAIAACSDTDSFTGPAAGVADPMLRLAGRDFIQMDRMGLPAVATVFIPTAQKDAYNTAEPANDRRDYIGEVISHLTAFGNPNPTGLANALLPDIIPFTIGSSAGFLNGRRLVDDVITAELGLIFGSNAALNDDHVDQNDLAFKSSFPYLADPQ